MTERRSRRPGQRDGAAPNPELVEELRELDRRSAEELRALRLPVEREPAFVFRPRP